MGRTTAVALGLALTTAATMPAAAQAQVSRAAAMDTAVFAGGCFWGVEAVFEHIRGVASATSGYAGGTTAAPGYDEVSSGRTGHAESVLVVFDPARISYRQLLEVFFAVAHDPTQLNRQGPDVGTQYRSAIFFRNPGQRQQAVGYIRELQTRRAFSRPIVTQVAALRAFHPAEAYHQDYLVRHPNQPYIVYHDLPKLEALRTRYPAIYRS
jgi:peptide-methionine (S)-S-oxide reductase